MTTTISSTLEEKVDRLASQVDFLVERAEASLEAKQSLTDLTGDLTPIARQGLDGVSRVMADLERRGYVDFARSGAGVMDRIVSSFSATDVEALGDNVVLILETVKEMTQPEVMQMLQSSLHNVSEIDDSGDPPSLFSILGQMRDPEVRRGLERLLAVLRTMGRHGATNL